MATPLNVAVLGGGAVALAAFAMPIGVLEGLVRLSGLPSALPMTEPPLGITARALAGLISGVLTGICLWVGLHLRAARRPRRADRFEIDPFAEAPVRRRSFLPAESEPRRPIFAEADLGAPFVSVRAAEEPAVPLLAAPAEPEEAQFEEVQFEEIEEEVEAFVAPRPAAFEEAEPMFDADWAGEEIAEAKPVFAEPITPAPIPDVENLAALLRRFEDGLDRKRRQRAATLERLARVPAQTATDLRRADMDEALRDALGTLQRMALRTR